MARLRNVVVDFLVADRSFDYIFMWDFDITGRLYIDGIAHSIRVLEARSDIDGMCAMSLTWWPFGVFRSGWLYADAFAYRPLDGKSATDREAWDRFLDTKRGDPPQRVKSCFGGFAIYRDRVIRKGARYDSSAGAVCEHVSFHHHLVMYQNPSMVYAIVSNENSLSLRERVAAVARWLWPGSLMLCLVPPLVFFVALARRWRAP